MDIDSAARAVIDDPVLAAATDIFARQGAAGLTMRALADAIGTSTQAIYTRYGGKAGLMEALAMSGAAELGERLAAVPETMASRARVMAMAEAYCGFATGNPALFDLLFGGGAQGRGVHAAVTGALHPLRRAVTAMGGDIGMADAVWAAAQGTVVLYLRGRLSAEQAQHALSRAVGAVTDIAAHPVPAAEPERAIAPGGPVAALVHWIRFG